MHPGVTNAYGWQPTGFQDQDCHCLPPSAHLIEGDRSHGDRSHGDFTHSDFELPSLS